MWQKALLWSHDGTGRTAHPNRPMAALARTICRAVELEWALNQNSVFVRASIFGMDSYKISRRLGMPHQQRMAKRENVRFTINFPERFTKSFTKYVTERFTQTFAKKKNS